MFAVVLVIHAVVCVLLISIVLIQRGRGGGLSESFTGLETMLGTRTSAALTKMTTYLAVAFFITCLMLAFISIRRSASLIRSVPGAGLEEPSTVTDVPVPAPADNATSDPQTAVPEQTNQTQQ